MLDIKKCEEICLNMAIMIKREYPNYSDEKCGKLAKEMFFIQLRAIEKTIA